MKRIVLMVLLISITGLFAFFVVNADSDINEQSQPAQDNNPCNVNIIMQNVFWTSGQCALDENQEFEISPTDPLVMKACGVDETPPILHKNSERECDVFCELVDPSCTGEISDFDNKYEVTCGLEVEYKELADGSIGELFFDAPTQGVTCVKTFKCKCLKK